VTTTVVTTVEQPATAGARLDADLHGAMQAVHDLQDTVGNTEQNQSIERVDELCKEFRHELDEVLANVDSCVAAGKTLANSGPMELSTQQTLEGVDDLREAMHTLEHFVNVRAFSSFLTRGISRK